MTMKSATFSPRNVFKILIGIVAFYLVCVLLWAPFQGVHRREAVYLRVRNASENAVHITWSADESDALDRTIYPRSTQTFEALRPGDDRAILDLAVVGADGRRMFFSRTNVGDISPDASSRTNPISIEIDGRLGVSENIGAEPDMKQIGSNVGNQGKRHAVGDGARDSTN